MREYRKQQMELQLAQEMHRMNEGKYQQEQYDDQENQYPDEDYEAIQNYQMQQAQPEEYSYEEYKPSVAAKKAPLNQSNRGGISKPPVVTGGRLPTKKGDDNKFSLSYIDNSKGGAVNPYQTTSSSSYGNHEDLEKYGFGKKAKVVESKVFGKQTPTNEKGYNVITGDYR